MNTKKLFNIFMIISLILFIFVLLFGIMLKAIMPNDLIVNYNFLSTMSLKERFLRGINLVEFYQIEKEIGVIHKTIILDILNIVVFVPFGIFIAHFFKKCTVFITVVISFLFSLIIELFQLKLIIGSFMLNDLIFNVLGGLIGSIVYVLVIKVKNYKLFNILLIIFNSISFIIFSYLLVNFIKHIDIYISLLF